MQHQRRQISLQYRIFDRIENILYIMRIDGGGKMMIYGGICVSSHIHKHL